MKTFDHIDKTDLKVFGIIHLIDIKAMTISIGNYQDRKDERNCSLQTWNNPNRYKMYKN